MVSISNFYINEEGDALWNMEKQVFRGAAGRGVSRLYTVCAPKLAWKKDIQNLQNLLFVSYDLESCEVFT